VRHRVSGNTIILTLPPAAHDRVVTSRFQAEMLPNGRLAGLVRREGKSDDGQLLVPFVFAEVRLPHAPADHRPELHGRLPGNHWVFNWDPRRRCGYLLAVPRSRDKDELRFHVRWKPADSAKIVATP
jgi:hypothetical protein